MIVATIISQYFLFSSVEAQTSARQMSGWAWSSNIGWVNFRGTDSRGTPLYGVNVDPSTGALSGYAWSSNLGWLSFNSTDSRVCGTPAVYNNSTKTFSGFAVFLSGKSRTDGWDGCVKLGNSGIYGWIVTNARKGSGNDQLSTDAPNFAWGSTVVGWFKSYNLEISGNTNDTDVPFPVATSGDSCGLISVSWEPVTGASAYNVYKSTSVDSGYTVFAKGTTTTNFIDNTLDQNGGQYFYKVSSIINGVESALSSPVSANAQIAGCTGSNVPAPTAATGASCGYVNISWPPVSGATGYSVYRSASVGGAYSLIISATTSAAIADNTQDHAGATFYYKVTSIVGGVESPQSNPVSAAAQTNGCVVLNPPSSVSAGTGSLCGGIDISWNAAVGAHHYYVYRSTSAAGTYVNRTPGGILGLTYTDQTSSSLGNTYYYKVSSANAAGDQESALSSPAASASANTSACPAGIINASIDSFFAQPPVVPKGRACTLEWHGVTGDTNCSVYKDSISVANKVYDVPTVPFGTSTRAVDGNWIASSSLQSTTQYWLQCNGVGAGALQAQMQTKCYLPTKYTEF